MKKSDVIPAWGRILMGYRPFLSIEITKECPLQCPGCYAYEPEHLGGGSDLRQLSDLRGDDLVNGVVALVQRHRPIHVSIIGGEPLVRYRELNSARTVVADETREMALRWTYRHELRHLLELCGFTVEAEYGDFAGGAPTYGAELIVVARRKASP